MTQSTAPGSSLATSANESARPILRATGLRKTFRMGNDDSLTVLKHADLTLKAGEFVAIEGRSGSGKSTLLHLLGALDTADEGTLQFEGRDYTRHNQARPGFWVRVLGSVYLFLIALVVSLVAAGFWISVRVMSPDANTRALLVEGKLQGGELAEATHAVALASNLKLAAISLTVLAGLLWVPHLIAVAVRLTRFLVSDRSAARVRNRDFGFVFQFYHLLPELNVLENTMLTSMIQHSWRGFFKRRAQLRARATEVLEQLGMGHRLRHHPNQLSGGERQRVAIARALMNNPKVIFADEPTGNLDIETGKQIMSVLEKLHQQKGQTIVMVTHDRTLARRADRVLVMKDGKLERADA